MPLETFDFTPSYSTELDAEERILASPFGDGYQQRAPDGINAKRLRFHVVFLNIRSAKADAIQTFLRARGGTEAFEWTPPAPYDDGPLKFTCEQPFRHRYQGYDNESIEAVFIQDFNPVP